MPGERPDGQAIIALVKDNAGFAVSHEPADPGVGGNDVAEAVSWVELLANGLTFDLVGLAPGRPAEKPPYGPAFGLPDRFAAESFEAITLQPGPHLAAGGAMLPVVRSLAWLSALLTDLPAVRAVAWHSARSWCAPAYYRDSVLRWIEGGAFPGLGLAALAPTPDGGMQSQGLALFTGQELWLEPGLVADRAAGAKIGLRLMHWLVEHGRLEVTERVPCPDGQPLRLDPSNNGRIVKVWKE
jgi:hypothetical protein